MTMFRRLRDQVDATLGFPLQRLGDAEAVAAHVLSKSSGAVLLLTACIEWFTQRHYLECFEDDGSLDPFVKRIFKMHWAEEAQHAIGRAARAAPSGGAAPDGPDGSALHQGSRMDPPRG